MTDGLFISIEGIDGSGKSTVVEAAEDQLTQVVTSREPAEQYWTGEATRRAINSDSTHPMTDFHFFLGDRAYHIKHAIVPALESGKTFISDRYADSTRAYQREALDGVIEDPAQYIDDTMGEWVIEPDLTILIDISAEESARRSSSGDKYEASEFLRAVRQHYLDIAEDNPRMITVDGERSEEEVVGEALTIINEAQAQHVLRDQ